MAPVLLPSSLSPHICILSSPDLSSLLKSSALPPLPQILQSFSPLPNVTTRSTSLTPIPHSSFALRFSELLEIEAACREADEQRAVRTIDWIGARVTKRCAKWVQEVEITPEKEGLRTPWWDELRRCAEGDHVPSKAEGWNHPVSVIFAVSTMTANPLQVITALHARVSEFPSWVDTTFFRYTLIIHPKNSPLSNEEAGALFNAVKKQFGLHSYILPLELPSPPPVPVPVPALLPRLPPPEPETSAIIVNHTPSSPSSTSHSQGVETLAFCEGDIQQTGKFTRELVVMSLIPWMEKCVLEWNENFTSTRRLPSRLFSSTRRLFGSPSPSPAPGVPSSAPSLPRSSYSSTTGRVDMIVPPPSQQRRLAEFATILGDYKLAITVWDAIRKDAKGGADVLPILLSPSLTIPTFVLNALSDIYPSSAEPSPRSQLRALMHAVRWEAGIPTSDFVGDVLGGERWLVWAAGDAEETPSALLLAHAALLCERKRSNRRAAFWYLMAASKLEKIGIKPLTMHFLRKAHTLYLIKPPKLLSPSFWNSEYQPSNEMGGLDAILAGIEHPLGRLLYTTGDVAGAVKLFIGLLRRSTLHYGQQTSSAAVADQQELVPAKLFLEDFQVALGHFKSTINDRSLLDQLRLPLRFCIPRHTRVRLGSDCSKHGNDIWKNREEAWISFRRNKGGKEQLERSGKAIVGETFWIDLVVQNPMDTEVHLTNFTVTLREETVVPTSEAIAQAEVISQIILGAREKQTISITIKPLGPATLIAHQVTYDFLSLLPSAETLSYRGRRLHDTPAQRQKPTHAPDVVFRVDVVEADHGLAASFLDEEISLLQGEYRDLKILLSNTGNRPITEIWLIADLEDELWLNESQIDYQMTASESEKLDSQNSLLLDAVYRIPNIATSASPLQPGVSKEACMKFHAGGAGRREISLLLTYREGEDMPFHSTRLSKEYEVQALFELGATARPCGSTQYLYMIDLEMANNHPSTVIELMQVSTLSPTWNCTSLKQERISLHPSQSSRVLIGASPWSQSRGVQETLKFVPEALVNVINGRDVQQRQVPPIALLCNHVHKTQDCFSVQSPMIQHFIQRKRQQTVSWNLTQSFPQVPASLQPFAFPLYNPFAVDVLVFWATPFKNRLGHIVLSNLTLGARHALLKEIIDAAGNAKANRSIYAETYREKAEILDALRNSEWNIETDPLSIAVQGHRNVVHDFSKGPCVVHASMVVRNYSITHTAQFLMKFPTVQERPSTLVLPYTGRTTFRGTLEPCKSTVIRPKLLVTQPGTYSLDNWNLTIEIFTLSATDKTALRYYSRQPYTGEIVQFVVSDIQDSQDNAYNVVK